MPSYATGRLAWGECRRCGLRFLLRELVLDGYYPNIRVCHSCYDAPQPQERLAVVSDPVALWKPAPDATLVPPPVLSFSVPSPGAVVLTWTSICGPPVGADHVGGHGAYLSAGYEVWRSSDGLTYAKIATLMNTADEFGALALETLTYTDTGEPVQIVAAHGGGYEGYAASGDPFIAPQGAMLPPTATLAGYPLNALVFSNSSGDESFILVLKGAPADTAWSVTLTDDDGVVWRFSNLTPGMFYTENAGYGVWIVDLGHIPVLPALTMGKSYPIGVPFLAGTRYYYVRGFDTHENAQNG